MAFPVHEELRSAAAPGEAQGRWVRSYSEWLSDYGYVLTEQTADTLRYNRRRSVPGIILGIFTFPISLIWWLRPTASFVARFQRAADGIGTAVAIDGLVPGQLQAEFRELAARSRDELPARADERRDEASPPGQVLAAPSDRLDRLRQLTDLRDAGALTPEEFESEKARILAS